jgi:D-alanyl-lipoteichoic acid acyltransferase DltB (MBOAT superfamily)
MLFNSPEFIAFFVFVYGLYLLLPFRPQNIMLLIASYVFYGWWDTRFLFLVALSTTVDFWVGLMLENGQLTRRQKLLPALFLVISALVFLGVNFEALWAHHTVFVLRDLIRIRMIGWASIGIAGFLAILYVVYCMLERSEAQRWRLWCLMVSLVTQLGLLGVFKYFNLAPSSALDN